MYKPVLSTVVLSSIAFNILAVLPNTVVSAEKNRHQPLPSWTKILHILFADKPPVEPRKGGSRDLDPHPFCMISPDAPPQPRVVWSDRPLFLWRGQINKIAVEDSSDHVLWSQVVNQTQHLTYTGKLLQPGQTYQWRVFLDDSSARFLQFQIMDSPQRDRLTADLHNLENHLKAKHSNSEAIALAKARYFANLNLWSDVLQQVYSVQKPSNELLKIIQKIPNHLCS